MIYDIRYMYTTTKRTHSIFIYWMEATTTATEKKHTENWTRNKKIIQLTKWLKLNWFFFGTPFRTFVLIYAVAILYFFCILQLVFVNLLAYAQSTNNFALALMQLADLLINDQRSPIPDPRSPAFPIFYRSSHPISEPRSGDRQWS